MSSTERLNLMQTLNAIMPEQLDVIIFTLTPPPGIIPPLPAAQGQRVAALLNWASAPLGCGLATVQQILDEVITPSLSEIAQGVQTDKQQEKSNAQYDMRGATIYRFAPGATGSNVISGQTIQGNTIIETQSNYSSPNSPNQSATSGGNEWPKIQKVHDNLGNYWNLEAQNINKALDTKTVLNIGDKLEYVIVASDLNGEDLEYAIWNKHEPKSAYQWQKSNHLELQIKPEDVRKRFEVTVRIRSLRAYHAYENYDDLVDFYYEVKPPNRKAKSENNYPRIEEVRDNFRNFWKLEEPNINKALDTKTVLNIGDKLEYVIVASDPNGEGLEYAMWNKHDPKSAYQWQKSNRLELQIKPEDVRKRFEVAISVRSLGAYHACGDYDDFVEFYYGVNPPTSLSSLKKSLLSQDIQIRLNAALALGKLGNEEAVPALCDVLEKDDSPEVRSMAAEALGLIGDQEYRGEDNGH